MSDLRKADEVIAIAVADLHLCHKRPLCRADEDWYQVMGEYLRQLVFLQKEHNCAVIVPGDVFDRWGSCPELINFAILQMPEILAIPGQHDLSYHSLPQIEKTAYWTLVQADVLRDLSSREQGKYLCEGVRVYGCPWGCEIPEPQNPDELNVLIIHAFVWKDGCGYPGAPEESHIRGWQKKFAKFDVVFSGDNHIPFDVKIGNTTVHNCGTFIRRKANEIPIQPSVCLLHRSGKVARQYLDTSADKFTDASRQVQKVMGDSEVLGDFLESLEELDLSSVDFRQQLWRVAQEPGVRQEVRDLLLEVLDGSRVE
jgi:hypothetical protein